ELTACTLEVFYRALFRVCRLKAGLEVAVIAKRLVGGFPAAAQGSASLMRQVNPRPGDGEIAMQLQRAIFPQTDRVLGGCGLRRTAVLALEVQRTGWTLHHDPGHLIGGRAVRLDPGATAAIKDPGKLPDARFGMDAAPDIVGDVNLIPGIALVSL